MAWSPDEINTFEEIASKLTSEAHLAQPETDNGLIPIFSLVNEITWSLPQDPEIAQSVAAIQEVIQVMLDEAKLFDEATIHSMRQFAKWCCDAVESLRNDTEIHPFAHEEKPAPPATQSEAPPPAPTPEPTKLPSFDNIDFSSAELPEEPATAEDIPSFEDLAAAQDATPEAIPAPNFDALDQLETDTDQADLQPESLSFEIQAETNADLPTAETSEAGWPLPQIEIFAKLSQQFSAELLLATAGSDEGMLPVYSLLKDFEADFENHDVISQALAPVIGKMDSLLDEASAYDNYAISLLTEFNVWLETTLSEIQAGRQPQAFTPAEEAPPAEPDSTITSNPEVEDDGLLAEFAQYDVVMDLNMEENEELLQEFHTEAVDHLGQIESAVLELEQDVTSRDAINSMFRSFHTIKGVAGFLNLVPVNRLAHEVESLMDLVRNDKLDVFTGIIDLVLASKDTITQLIEQITEALANGTEPSEIIEVSELMARARWAMEGPKTYAAKTGESSNTIASAPAVEEAPPAETEPLTETSAATPAEAPVPTAAAPQKTEAPKEQKTSAAAKRRAAENATIRVNTTKLDNLMDMVGELVIVQSQLLESSRQDAANGTTTSGDSLLQRNMSQLSRITKELQHTSMALRMIPVKPTFQKMGRIVRDIGAKCGKKVRFETFGEDTELDRNVVEEIGDPLVHMVRNALDHGLEATPEDRVAAGKDETGNISLKAYHQGSNIVIELADDGRGIDPERVLAKAIGNGIVSENDQLTNEEIYKLIFAPGFSTAAEITDISGRGVGMDVVKKNIEKLRGKVEIESELGKGSTFRILLPLTMAIVDGLVVKVGNDRFILPTTSVKVALRPDDEVLAKVQGNQEILNIRGQVIPLFRLHQHFAIPDAVAEPKDATVVVVETGGKPCGLLVDDMVSKQEVVIKSLGGMMQGIPGVSGGAILGDGTIALILDPATLVSAA